MNVTVTSDVDNYDSKFIVFFNNKPASDKSKQNVSVKRYTSATNRAFQRLQSRFTMIVQGYVLFSVAA